MDGPNAGNWLINAGIRRTSLRIITALEARFVDNDRPRFAELWGELATVNQNVLANALGDVMVLLTSLVDNPEQLLLAAEMKIIDRPAPPVPEV